MKTRTHGGRYVALLSLALALSACGGGGGQSDEADEEQNNPVPTLDSASPDRIVRGGADFTLTVEGSGFVAGSVVRWNGAERTTTFVSATQLTAAIGAADISTAGTADVTVFSPTPGGGQSGVRTVTIENPVPVATGVQPGSAIAGSAGVTLTVTGTGFGPDSVGRWNGGDRPTTFDPATPGQLQVEIAAADIGATGVGNVTVFNPGPGGGTSTPQSVAINNPVPVATGLGTANVQVGGPAFDLVVDGNGFNADSVVRWGGAALATRFDPAAPTRLTAAVPAGNIVAAGAVEVRVFNPGPGGGESDALTITVVNTRWCAGAARTS